MAILIDPPLWPAHGTLWSHLISDTGYDELHAFAARLGVPRRGFDLDHYDVPAARHADAVALGAITVGSRDVVHRLRESGLRVKRVDRAALAPIRRREFLVTEWARLGDLSRSSHANTAVAEWHRIGDNLLKRWSEPHRSYHDETHLEDVLLALDQFAVQGERIAVETLLAAWFHDAVYAGLTGDDERDSAALASHALRTAGLDHALVDRVRDLVLGTVPGVDHTNPVTPLAHLLDADLAILGADELRYARYSAAVRAEYAHVAEPEFRAARATILEAYQRRPEIYRTAVARGLWEQRAQTNLAREIGALRAPPPSVSLPVGARERCRSDLA